MDKTKKLFLSLMDGSIDSVLDVQGRPLGESPVLAAGTAVKTEFRRCPYDDSRGRDDLQINYSALKQVGTCWPQLLSLLLAIRTKYVGKYGVSQIEQRDIWRIWQIALAMPDYLLHKRAQAGDDSPIPVWAAALFKVARGFGRLHGEIYFRELVGAPAATEELTGESVYRTADRGGNLISGFGACAGPKEMIIEAAEVVVSGMPSTGGKPIDMNGLIDSFDDFFGFASHASDLLLINFLFIAEQYHTLAELKKNDSAAAAVIAGQLQAMEDAGGSAANYPTNVKALAATLGGLDAFVGMKFKMLELVAVDLGQILPWQPGTEGAGHGTRNHLEAAASGTLFAELFGEGERYLELLSRLMEKIARPVGIDERARIERDDVRRIYGALPGDAVFGLPPTPGTSGAGLSPRTASPVA